MQPAASRKECTHTIHERSCKSGHLESDGHPNDIGVCSKCLVGQGWPSCSGRSTPLPWPHFERLWGIRQCVPLRRHIFATDSGQGPRTNPGERLWNCDRAIRLRQGFPMFSLLTGSKSSLCLAVSAISQASVGISCIGLVPRSLAAEDAATWARRS